MFERFTEQARRVLFFARYEASQLGSPAIGSEHLLLGLLREGKGVTGRIFERAGLDSVAVHMEIGEAVASRPKIATHVEIPIASDAKAVLQHATDEADRLRHGHVGGEHLLLGLLHLPDSAAGAILIRAGFRLDDVRASVVSLIQEGRPRDCHVVLVQVTIRPEMSEEFEAALLHNARESVRRDPGCLRFDVSQDKEHPSRWVLYEVYENPQAHAVHRQSPHFLAYDAVATRAVVEKTVAKCTSRFVTP
jgi:ATP-dependent Clp protease ATP-binding subunit ClpC